MWDAAFSGGIICVPNLFYSCPVYRWRAPSFGLDLGQGGFCPALLTTELNSQCRSLFSSARDTAVVETRLVGFRYSGRSVEHKRTR